MSPADKIASEIVGRYAWTSNVKHNGRLVGQQVLVARDICAAVERERAELADLKRANKLLHSLIASRDHDIGQLYEAMGKDRDEIKRLRTAANVQPILSDEQRRQFTDGIGALLTAETVFKIGWLAAMANVRGEYGHLQDSVSKIISDEQSGDGK